MFGWEEGKVIKKLKVVEAMEVFQIGAMVLFKVGAEGRREIWPFPGVSC
jgi:hypothetical protein